MAMARLLRRYHDRVADLRPTASAGWAMQELVEGVIGQQRRVAARTAGLAAAGRQPQATWAAQGHLAELESRIRWSVVHRSLS